MAKKKTLPAASEIFKAAFTQIETGGVGAFSLEHLANDLNVEPGLLAPMLNDPASLAAAFGRFVDQSVAQEVGADEGGDEPAHDRLFEVLMARFDILQEYRGGVITLSKEARRHPAVFGELASALPKSMERMLDLAGLLTDRSRRGLQVAGLTALWLRCARTWMKDEGDDMPKTMSVLDKSLKDAGSIARRLF
ncbi:MAG: hypothetical protein AAF221_09655 [Pseudomonadota bacterium]